MNSGMQAVEIRTFWPGQLCQFPRGSDVSCDLTSGGRARGGALRQENSAHYSSLERRRSMKSLGRSKALAALGLILTLAVAAVALVSQTHQAQANSNAIAPWSD